MKAATTESLRRLPQWVRAHIAALQADKDRLDWMEANPFMAYRSIDPENYILSGHFTAIKRGGRTGIVKFTFREAIDEARK